MNKIPTLQAYLNNFRRHLARYLQPGIGVSAKVYPSHGPGAVIEFTVGPLTQNIDEFAQSVPRLGDALNHIKQRAFGGDIGGIRFGGTNVVLEDNRILLIKGDDTEDAWTDRAASEDVDRVIHGRDRRRT